MFTEGAIKNGIEQATAEAIFDQMEKFASYGFNKSHAAAYSLISYQTAYLKAHYPVEFLCAVMSLDITNTEKLLLYKEECKKMGFEVLKPDINKSGADFAVEDGNIRYALGAIKGVGAANMQAIEDERRAHGPYKDLSDFIHRTDIKQINRRQMEQLAKAGAFDCLDKNRGKIFANIETIMQHIAAASELKTSSQASLFGTEELHTTVKLADKPDWPELEKLKLEAEASAFIFPRTRSTAMPAAWSGWGLKPRWRFSITLKSAIRFAPNWPAVSIRCRNASAKAATNMPLSNFPMPPATLKGCCFPKVWPGLKMC